jgi:hypothetical protein
MAEEGYKQRQFAAGMVPGLKEASTATKELVADKQKEAEEWVKSSERMHQADAVNESDMAKLALQAKSQKASFTIDMAGGGAKDKEKAAIEEAKALTKIQVDEITNYEKWLDKNNPKELEKYREFEQKKQKLIAEGEQKVTKIKNDALLAQEQATRAAEDRMAQAIASAAAKSIMSGKSMGAAFKALGEQMAQTALTNFMQMETLDGRKKMKDAGKAARGAYTGVMDMDLPPFIAFPLAIASGAAAFGGVMAFEQGGIVPETGLMKLHEKEMVLPRPIAEKVQAMADPQQNGGRSGRGVVNNFQISTPNADSFMLSQRQIDNRAVQAHQKALRRG